MKRLLSLCQRRTLLMLAVCALALLPVNQAQTVDSTRYWMKIKAADKFERSVLSNMGIAIDVALEDYVIATGNVEDMQIVEKLGWLETSFAMPDSLDFPSDDAIYHDYDELTQEIQALVQANPNFVKLTSIGKSLEGRDIWNVQISTDLETANQKPGIVFMGGHHAREHLSVEIPLKLINYMITEFNAGNEKIVSLVKSRDINIIPVVNPDGKSYDIASGNYQMWRKNRRNNSNGTY
ncbi:MAG: M14 family zinc carboxypeptidase, partial [Pseudobdellovibrionaceae bacterium]